MSLNFNFTIYLPIPYSNLKEGLMGHRAFIENILLKKKTW